MQYIALAKSAAFWFKFDFQVTGEIRLCPRISDVYNQIHVIQALVGLFGRAIRCLHLYDCVSFPNQTKTDRDLKFCTQTLLENI